MAPSPTGNLHLGGLRTALYNFLYARQHPEGKFVLRIEDTDQVLPCVLVSNTHRQDSRRTQKKTFCLHLLGLAWTTTKVNSSLTPLTVHTGPKKEGPYGPYTQSHRTKLYQEHAQKLLEVRTLRGRPVLTPLDWTCLQVLLQC